MGRNRLLHIGLTLILGLALAFSLASYLRTRSDLRTVMSANRFLKKTLGEMAVAISAKDREINRLIKVPCQSKGEPGPVSPQTRVPERTVYE
jgi:hypothetical protein